MTDRANRLGLARDVRQVQYSNMFHQIHQH
jgi:hypothetical protein